MSSVGMEFQKKVPPIDGFHKIPSNGFCLWLLIWSSPKKYGKGFSDCQLWAGLMRCSELKFLALKPLRHHQISSRYTRSEKSEWGHFYYVVPVTFLSVLVNILPAYVQLQYDSPTCFNFRNIRKLSTRRTEIDVDNLFLGGHLLQCRRWSTGVDLC